MDMTSFNNLLISGAYYLIVAFLTFFAVFGVYILIRYGRSVLFALIVDAVFIMFYLVILSNSYRILQRVLNL